MRIVNIELNRWMYLEVKNLGAIRVFVALDEGEYVFYFDTPKAISIRREEYVIDVKNLVQTNAIELSLK